MNRNSFSDLMNLSRKLFFIFISLLLGPFMATGQTSLEEIIGDMTLPHEGNPHGVPASYNWSRNPRAGAVEPPAGWNAAIAWGQLYEWIEGNPAVNTRVQIKDLEMYYLGKSDHTWHLLQKSLKVDGASYVEDFVDDIHKPADKRTESDGSISVTCGDGYNFHFWPSSGRVSYPANEVAGCFVTVKARLILHDPDGIDDRDSARYLMSVGGDWWESLTAVWDQWKTNADMGIGRFRFVTEDWKSFSMFSVPADTLLNNPPPFKKVTTGISQEKPALPSGFVLEQNYPNPFTTGTQIRFILPYSGKTKISLYTPGGNLIHRIFENHASMGLNEISWDATGLAAGNYILRLDFGGFSNSIQCMVVN